MINEELIERMEKLLDVASDKTRLKILYSLYNEHRCHEVGHDCSTCTCEKCMMYLSVSEIVLKTGCSQSLVSHQLKVLKDNHLVKSKKDGRQVIYSLDDGHIKLLLNLVKEHVLEEEKNHD